MKIKSIFLRTVAIVVCIATMFSMGVTISASDLNDFFERFEEINETGYFRNDSVDLYYNPVQAHEKKVTITQSHMAESFRVEYKFTDDTGKAWYMINTEEWLPEAVIEDVYPGYVSVDEVCFTAPGVLTVLSDGNAISDAVIERNASMTLAVDDAGEFSEYRWQLLHKEQWVTILDATGETICITYPMVSGMLDGDESAQIRCVACDDEERAISEPITITVEEESEEYSVMTARAFSDANEVDDIMPADETADSGSELETYTVTIHYQYEDGKTAAPSWGGQFSKRAEVNQTIKNPTVTGFAPLEDSYTIYISSITEDKTYTVTYYPAEVDFTVKHYQQNVGNDSYSLKDTQTLQGITGSTVGEGLKKEYEGFYAYNYDTTLEIAADGSTVVEIYYDRYYYLLSFDLNGGYGVEPIYARYDTPISVGTPNRPGYSFTGWDGEVPLTMPAGNTRLEASWTPTGNTTYTVVYWAENANDDDYSIWGYTTKTGNAGDVVSGTDDFAGTQELPKNAVTFDHADQNITIAGDNSTVVNVYYKRNTWTLTFAYEDGPLICDMHVHSTGCYELSCGKKEHEHTYEGTYKGSIFSTRYYVGGCYAAGDADAKTGGSTEPQCGIEEHKHTTGNFWTDSCYSDELICGQTAVNNHTHSVANGCYGMKFENIKYGQATDAFWSQAPTLKWLVDPDDTTFYTNAPAMPNSNLIIYGTTQSGSSTIHYYEKVDGKETTNSIHPDYVVNTEGWSFTKEDYIDIPGFTYSSSRSEGDTYYIYYTRNSYKLSFMNSGEEVSEHTATYLYEGDISGTGFTPDYPETLEPNAYVFDGWYTSPTFGDTEFAFANATMPANDLILYVKWTPKTHTVTIYKTDARVPEEQIGDTQTVPHGSYAVAPTTPTNGSYSFVGWFYKGSDGIERGFDFSMPVNQDLELYAKWSSNVLVPYTIRYAVKASDGTYTYIAPETTGQALAGQTRTFLAKAGDDLDDGYREGYFPETSSHSITPSAEDPAENTYTFVYVQKDKVPYTVRYMDKGTGEPLENAKNVETSKAIVTETFVVINGYMPDAYQKTLVLSANGENIITFWYIKDDIHAPVQVIHYIQNAAGDGYTVYQNTSNLNTEINDTFSADILQIDGFVFDHAKANKNEVQPTEGGLAVSGTVTAEGLVLELYYNRNLYPYAFRFVEKGTNIELAEPLTGTARYGAQVVEKAAVIPGYACAQATGAIVIKMENEALQNVFTFYYERALADLTIKKSGAQVIDKNQSFIFEVRGTDPNTKDISLTVVVIGDGSVTIRDLPVGEYTVEEKNGWSWRYTPAGGASQKVTVDADGETVDFANKRSNELWLDGNHWLDNRFKIKETPADETLADEEVEADA